MFVTCEHVVLFARAKSLISFALWLVCRFVERIPSHWSAQVRQELAAGALANMAQDGSGPRGCAQEQGTLPSPRLRWSALACERGATSRVPL